MAKAALTKRTVDAAKPAASDQFIWDTEVSGFGLKVTPAGSKVYVFQYRIARPGEAEWTPAKRVTIGKHGGLTADQARKRAKELAALVGNGIDPRQRELDAVVAKDEAERQEQEKARIDGELAFSRYSGLWLDYYENEKGRRPSSVELAKLVVNRYLKPALGEKPIPYIGRSELQPIFDGIPASRKGIRRLVFAYASVLFGWAMKRGDIAENPLVMMEKPEAPKARDRVLSDSELVEIWRASETLVAPFGAFLRLLILTGQRRNEVAAMKWSELDRTNATWVIPADRAKNHNAHIVPLSTGAMDQLDVLAGCTASDEDKRWPKVGFVLTTTGRAAISSFSRAKKSLDTAIVKARRGETQDNPVQGEDVADVEMISPWRIHDLRRTLATGFQRLGIRFEVTEAVLNHISGVRGGISGIYQRHDWKDEKSAALQAWANHVSAILSTSGRDNVVDLQSASPQSA